MKSVQKIDLGLTGYDELFMNDAERKENKLPRIYVLQIQHETKLTFMIFPSRRSTIFPSTPLR